MGIALFPAYGRGMAKLSDQSPAASAVRDAQAERLTRLRQRLGLSVAKAAELGGVSRFAWARMEQARANLDGVALARFVTALGLPSEYVVTGRFDGLPPGLQRELIQVEAREAMEAAGGAVRSFPPPGPAPRGRKRRKSTARTASEATPTGASKPVPENA